MSQITEPVVLNSTAREILEAMKTQNGILAGLAAAGEGLQPSTLPEVANIVRLGVGQNVFHVGDQLNIDWMDGSTEYTVPCDIVHFENVDLQDGENLPGMFLQWHYCTPSGVQFDAAEAFYYAETELPAGTYNVIVGENWGVYCKSGETYQFTLTKPVPAGGQIAGFAAMPDKAPSDWRISTYESQNATVAIETVTTTAGTSGTNLGKLTKTGDGKLNSIQRVAYGYNRWSQSALRQYLNSDKPAGKWWSPQNNYDRPPAELETRSGFMAGMSDEFLACLKPVRVRTALNTVTDSAVGTYEDTYDTFFLPAMEQEFISPQLKEVEGTTWEYWMRASKRSSMIPKEVAGSAPITYAINGKTSPQAVRLRSANRGNACSAWCVNTSGGVSGSSAVNSNRFAPACVIC